MVPGRNQFMKILLPAKITRSNRPAALHLTAEECDVSRGAEAFTGPASSRSSWPADPGPFWPLSDRQSLRLCSCPPRTAALETRGGALLHPPPPSCPHWWVSLPSLKTRRRRSEECIDGPETTDESLLLSICNIFTIWFKQFWRRAWQTKSRRSGRNWVLFVC